MVEGHSKAFGLGEVFDLMHAPTNFPLSPNFYIIAKNKSPETVYVDRDLYVLCRVMLHQQFDTMLNCFIRKSQFYPFEASLLH